MSDDFNQKLITELATASLREKRAQRRWSIFFRFILFAYIITVTILYAADLDLDRDGFSQEDAHAAIVQINGVIEAGGPNSSNNINALLRAAFRDDDNKGIILEINSPGGSAVESNRIYNEIMRLREKHPEKRIIAVAGDFCTSGGYYIAAAAEEIYADPGSIIGSIGVIFSSFGFSQAMEKLGIERRVQTAGGSKNLLDPFSPESPEGKQAIDNILRDVHRVFRQAVLDGRGDKLVQDDPRLFNGTVFSGSESMTLGLIDGFNDIGGVARDILDVEQVLYYNKEQDWLDTLIGRFESPRGGVLARGRH